MTEGRRPHDGVVHQNPALLAIPRVKGVKVQSYAQLGVRWKATQRLLDVRVLTEHIVAAQDRSPRSARGLRRGRATPT